MGACYGGDCACPVPPAEDAGVEADGADDADAAPSTPVCATLIASATLPIGEPGLDYVGGLALVPSTEGFVLAFREQAGASADAGSTSSVRTLLMNLQGRVQTQSAQPIDAPCPGGMLADDGVGLALPGSGPGLLATSLPACDPNAGAGVMIYPLGGDGTLLPGNPIRLRQSGDLSLAAANALSPSYTPTGGFELMFVSGSLAYDSTLAPGKIDPTLRVQLPSTAPQRAAVAASTTLRAELAVLQGGGAEVYTSPAANDPTPTPSLATTIPNVTTGALAIAPSGASGLAVGVSPWALVAQSFGSPSEAASGYPGTFRSAAVTALSLTSTGSFALVAASESDLKVQLTDVYGASIAPPFALASSQVLADQLHAFDGEHVATAWTSGVLAVAWLSGYTLNPGVPKGGWALFACP
jgi:hypothetical protein